MFKILIVDDEKIVRDGLRKTIDWRKLDCEIVAEATNGLDGYKKYLEYKPDIIITDIRMKKSDGLEFIKRMKETAGFDSEVIIFTAFNEFDYAKVALENGASSYLLKPIKDSELISAVQKLKVKLIERRQKDNLIENMVSHLSQVRDTFLLGVLNGSISNPAVIEEKCIFLGIVLPEKEFTVANIKVDNLQLLNGNISEVHNRLLDSIEYVNHLPDSPRSISCTIEECNVALLIYRHDDDYKVLQSSAAVILNYLTEIKEQFEVMTGLTLSAGYSKSHNGVNEISMAYKEAQKALQYKSFVGNNTIIDFLSVPKYMNGALIFPKDDINIILASVKKGDKQTTFEILDTFFEKIKKTPSIDIESLKNVVLEMVIVLLQSTFKNPDEINRVYGRKLVPANELKLFETISEIETWTREIVIKLYSSTPEENMRNYSKKIYEIKAIIERDYQKSLSIAQVAEELYISPYYLMHFFKEETGKTFNQYLTEFRIEKAKELMRTSKYKVYEIGEMVGYKNPMYFSYIFKKITGTTPKKFANYVE